jgi:hypothetical protein
MKKYAIYGRHSCSSVFLRWKIFYLTTCNNYSILITSKNWNEDISSYRQNIRWWPSLLGWVHGIKCSGMVRSTGCSCYQGNRLVKIYCNLLELPHKLATEDNLHRLDVFSITGKIDLIQYFFIDKYMCSGLKVMSMAIQLLIISNNRFMIFCF